MNLKQIIKSAEGKYLQILEEFFTEKWGKTLLYSHDIDHHRRVWHYAKELLTEIGKRESDRLAFSPDMLLIACYLHDLGMSVDIGERHGNHSSRFCREFLSKNGLSENKFSEVPEAIRNHDRKDHKSFDDSLNLSTFLSSSDDLDAFGYIGVYRYAEIYLLRGVDPGALGEKVLKNLRNRFLNFENNFREYPKIILKHKSRYIETISFYENYSKHSLEYKFKSGEPTGYCGVIEIFSDFAGKITSLNEILNNQGRFANDKVINTVIERILNQLTASINPV
jgi:HD superfamily phosphodiesterase